MTTIPWLIFTCCVFFMFLCQQHINCDWRECLLVNYFSCTGRHPLIQWQSIIVCRLGWRKRANIVFLVNIKNKLLNTHTPLLAFVCPPWQVWTEGVLVFLCDVFSSSPRQIWFCRLQSHTRCDSQFADKRVQNLHGTDTWDFFTQCSFPLISMCLSVKTAVTSVEEKIFPCSESETVDLTAEGSSGFIQSKDC